MLNNLKPTKGSRQKRHRVGRGVGSGWGETAGKGFKGQLARSGGGPRPGFEGGQLPLFQRIPKRGFHNVNRKEYAIVNLGTINDLFKDGDIVTPEVLLETGVLSKLLSGVKVLASGDFNKKLTVKAHKFSKQAQEKLRAAKSTFEEIKNVA